ncbi:hypothetical protein Adt_35081 [Abeliophyllum distichum]|uniref:Putative plant transposon protein domain-containing protein n=1 Tax=Abeliophyllum distichum TaxID=126358 RepID=A0ABD1QDQ3_9LAMI
MKIDHLPTEQDRKSVARFLYGRENAWPLTTSHFKHDELTRELRALHIFVCININLTTHRTKFTGERARFLYHLARGQKIDLGTHIYDFVRDLATSVDSNNSQRCIMFPCMISGIYLEDRVPLLPFEEADAPEAPLNHKTIENSEAKMLISAFCALIRPDEAAHDPAPPVPQPALAAEPNHGIYLTQIQVALTEIGRSMNTVQNTLIEVRHMQRNMQQELLRVRMLVRGLQYDDVDIRSNQRTINYAYDDVNRRMIHFGSRLEMIDRTISQIAEAIDSLRPST